MAKTILEEWEVFRETFEDEAEGDPKYVESMFMAFISGFSAGILQVRDMKMEDLFQNPRYFDEKKDEALTLSRNIVLRRLRQN